MEVRRRGEVEERFAEQAERFVRQLEGDVEFGVCDGAEGYVGVVGEASFVFAG